MAKDSEEKMVKFILGSLMLFIILLAIIYFREYLPSNILWIALPVYLTIIVVFLFLAKFYYDKSVKMDSGRTNSIEKSDKTGSINTTRSNDNVNTSFTQNKYYIDQSKKSVDIHIQDSVVSKSFNIKEKDQHKGKGGIR